MITLQRVEPPRRNRNYPKETPLIFDYLPSDDPNDEESVSAFDSICSARTGKCGRGDDHFL